MNHRSYNKKTVSWANRPLANRTGEGGHQVNKFEHGILLWTDKHDYKNYLPAASLAGDGNKSRKGWLRKMAS